MVYRLSNRHQPASRSCTKKTLLMHSAASSGFKLATYMRSRRSFDTLLNFLWAKQRTLELRPCINSLESIHYYWICSRFQDPQCTLEWTTVAQQYASCGSDPSIMSTHTLSTHKTTLPSCQKPLADIYYTSFCTCVPCHTLSSAVPVRLLHNYSVNSTPHLPAVSQYI